MSASTNLIISCYNFSRLPAPYNNNNLRPRTKVWHLVPKTILKTQTFFKTLYPDRISVGIMSSSYKKGGLQIRRSVLDTKDSDRDPVMEGEEEAREEEARRGREGRDWTTSILLFVFWSGLTYYAFILSPNQTPSMDLYILKKLLNLTGDDGYKMNEVLLSLWYLMGLWPLAYSMLLVPTGRSSNSSIPVWPFLVLSFFLGAYGLIPYFVLWKPPPPPVEESEIRRWPLKFLDSKWVAQISLAAGLGLIVYAGLASGDTWKEFYQYFRQSRFIHAMSIDFAVLSTFAPFWVYNDMTARRWYDKGFWLLPISLVPFLGPALYLVLRPSLSEMVDSLGQNEQK